MLRLLHSGLWRQVVKRRPLLLPLPFMLLPLPVHEETPALLLHLPLPLQRALLLRRRRSPACACAYIPRVAGVVLRLILTWWPLTARNIQVATTDMTQDIADVPISVGPHIDTGAISAAQAAEAPIRKVDAAQSSHTAAAGQVCGAAPMHAVLRQWAKEGGEEGGESMCAGPPTGMSRRAGGAVGWGGGAV